MKPVYSVPILVVLAMVTVLSLPSTGISQVVIKKPLVVAKAKTFTPVMAYLVRNHRLLVGYSGLWKRPGDKYFKGPKMTLSIARSWYASGRRMLIPNTSDVTYHITVRANDYTSSDGTRHISQTITTTGSDGSSYSDTMTHNTDRNGNTTETQTVSQSDKDGTVSESTETSSAGDSGSADDPGFITGGNPNWCWGIMCSAWYQCCSFCPKELGCTNVVINYY